MGKEFDFKTPKAAFDNLFGDNNSSEQITEISVFDLEPSPFNKFKPYPEDKMQELVESIKVNGVLEPIIVRRKDIGYEILAGHNRTKATRLAGKDKIPAIIKEDVTDVQALNIVTYTNLKRDKIYPSELAQTYKLLMEVNNATSCRTLAEIVGDNKRKIQRYYRLNFLTDELSKMVDDEIISVSIGGILSYLKEFEQEILFTFLSENNIKIKEDDAQSLKRLSVETEEDISFELIMKMFGKDKQENKNKNYKITLDNSLYETYFANMEKKEIDSKIEEIIIYYFQNNK